MRVFKIASAVAIALAALAASTAPAAASFVFVGSRAALHLLGPTTSIDWGVYGPFGTTISTPDFRTVGPVTVGVASSQGVLSRHDEGTDFNGDFAPGDHLLTDAGSESDTFIVSFATPVRGFGTQMEADFITGAWTGEIELFDTSNTLIDTILTSGTRGTAEDNSAPFFGILSSSANISYAVFWVDQNPSNLPARSGAVAINTLDVLGTAAVPESSSIALLAMGLLWLGGLMFVRRRVS
jgi:hypothetical protein